MNAIYSLVFAALLLTVGKVGDLYGRRRILLVGIVGLPEQHYVNPSSAEPSAQ